jgi:hypothetical protein
VALQRQERRSLAPLAQEAAAAFFECGWLDPVDADASGARGRPFRCARLPVRYGEQQLLLNRNRLDTTRLFRAANAPPFGEMRRARFVHLALGLALGPTRPWLWWAASLMPLATSWRAALCREALTTANLAEPSKARRYLRGTFKPRSALSRCCGGGDCARAGTGRPGGGADVVKYRLALFGGGAVGAYAARGHAGGA